MKKLKMLEISFTWLSKARDNLRTLEWHGDPTNFMLSNELCVMEWWGYPLESLPAGFQSNNLVELIMPYSCVKQPWDGRKVTFWLMQMDFLLLPLTLFHFVDFLYQSFDKLKRISLSHCKNLIETPDLSGVPNLEELELEYCTSLSKVHPSIGFLRRLKGLYLRGCKRLKRLPDEICLESLEVLNLSRCSRLNKFPDTIGNMTSLRTLFLGRIAIKELPLSFKSLSSLVSLNISHCSRLEKSPKNLISGMECLEEFCVAGSGSDLISLLMPNSFSGLSSLRYLDFRNCNLLDGAIPNDLCCLSSLDYLNLSGNKFTRIPDSAWQLSNLIWLDLSYCNLLDGAIPNDLTCLSSLYSLKLSGNKFTRIPDSVCQLSRLRELYLEDCSWLQVLPKLPLGLTQLRVRNCPSLELFYNQMGMWTSNEKLSPFDCSFVVAYIDCDGKPFKILHLHPRSPLWTERVVSLLLISFLTNKIKLYYCLVIAYVSSFSFWSFILQVETIFTVLVCGPALVGSGIPEWFNDKITNSLGTIQMQTDLGSDDEWEGYALFIVYQVHEHESSNSGIFDGGNRNLPYFICQFQVNEVVVTEPLVICAPGAPFVGPSGFWVYIPARWFFERRARNIFGGECIEWSNLEASITTGSLNVEVKECGAHVVREHDASAFYQVLNSISPNGLDLESGRKSFLDLVSANLLTVGDPISIGSFEKKKKSEV
jgi:Leucine-rich repeat (LRR) protein